MLLNQILLFFLLINIIQSIDEISIRNCFINQTNDCFETTTTCPSTNNPDCTIYKYCKKKLEIYNTFSSQLNNMDDKNENECSWFLNTKKESNIKNQDMYLKFNKFSINYQFDYIYIFNGTSTNNALLAALSGVIRENTILILNNINQSPSIYILFQSKSINDSILPSFSIDYYITSEYIDQNSLESSISSSISTPLHSTCITYETDNSYDYKIDVFNLKRALHSVHLINQTYLYILGGYSYTFLTRFMTDYYKSIFVLDKNFNFILDYDLTKKKFTDYDVSLDDNEMFFGNDSYIRPLNRYSFSTVYDPINNRILMFGGLLLNTLFNDITTTIKYDSDTINYLLKINQTSFHHITDELWSFNLATKNWTLIDNIIAPSSERLPIGVCGHSSLLYKDVMFTFFGFSRYYGQLTLIQEFNLTSNQWYIRNLTNIPSISYFKSKFPIGYKHTSVLDENTNLIYIFGGLIIGEEYFDEQKPLISSYLYEYNPITHEMRVLKESKLPSYMHSANIYKDIMYIFGGLVLSPSNGLFKATKRIRFYNITENQWYNDDSIDIYDDLMTNKERYSHTAFIYNDSRLCIHGGFNNIFLNDLFCIDFECIKLDNNNNNNNSNQNDIIIGNNDIMLAKLLEFKKCDYYLDCYSCQYNPKCIWYENQCLYLYMFELKNDKKEVIDYLYEKKTCRKLCFKFQSCENCTLNSECIWCANTNLCLQKEQFKVIYSFGQCIEYIHEKGKCRLSYSSNLNITSIDISANIYGCLVYKNCSSCIEQENCGWCSLDDNKLGYGVCIDATSNLNNDYSSRSYCKAPNWHFNKCPICECNGHSYCNNDLTTCLACFNHTIGDKCSSCDDGYYGSSLNNGQCQKCSCNSQANTCDANDGRCYCFTKGVTGKYCSICEQPRYFGNPLEVNGTCYYDLSIDYQFTFNLNKESDKYYTRINFSNKPIRFDDDIDLTIKCVKYLDALFNVSYVLWYDYDLPSANNTNSTITTLRTNEIQLLNTINCSSSEYKYTFTTKDDNYYLLNNVNLNQKNVYIKNRTFFVYVYNFKTPIIIQISFTHKTRIQLLHFFITFFGCFLTLLAIAFILWKSKQRYDRYQRQRRLFIEMKQMASRPFTKLYIDLSSSNQHLVGNDDDDDDAAAAYISKLQEAIMPVAIEPLANNKTAILTVLLKLPDGGINNNNNENDNECYSSPFVFGSTLIQYDPNDVNEQVVGDGANDIEVDTYISSIDHKTTTTTTVIVDNNELNIDLEEMNTNNRNNNNNLISIDSQKNEAFV